MNLQEYLDEAYTAIYQQLPEAFPEFAFEPLPDGKGYKSSNYLKIDGKEGDKRGAVYVYADNFFGLKDYTRGFISIYHYIQQRDNLEHDAVLKEIARISAIPLPSKSYQELENKAYQQAMLISELLEATNSFFIDCLSHPDNVFAQSSKAKELRNYLLQVRGYYLGHLRLPEKGYNHQKPTMELGFMPGIAVLKSYLSTQGFDNELIESTLKIPQAAEHAHILTIPYRNKVGIIKGFTFRCTQNLENMPKYLYSSGLERGSILFNLRRSFGKVQDLIITEGILDAMNAAAHGLLHTVAIGGADLTNAQVKELLALNPQRVTLFLDNDEAGRIGTSRAIQKLLPYSKNLSIYVAELPVGIKDLDELLHKDGAEKAREIIKTAISLGKYLSKTIRQDFYVKIQGLDSVPDKALDELLHKTIETEISLKNPIDAAIFRQVMSELLQSYAINAEILQQKTVALQETQRQKSYLDSLHKLQLRIAKALQGEQIAEVEKLFDTEFRQIKTTSKVNQFDYLLQSQSEEALREAIKKIPQGFYSGYDVVLDSQRIPVPLPNGAISFFCAPTSHGKTTMLINLALNVALLYPDKQVHVFSYEEAQEPITLKALNAFADKELGSNNFQALEQYFAADDSAGIDPKNLLDFENSKQNFFKDLLGTGRLNIHYIDYSSENLIEAIYFLHSKQKADVVFIDYMQLLQIGAEQKIRLSRQEELKKICIDLKDCAVKTGLPLVLGAQFNREVVNPFRIHATKIGEAGDIERIASVVVGMWNNSFEPANLTADEEMRLDDIYKPNTIWVKLLKNRNGRVGGHALLDYNGNRGKIYSNTKVQTTNNQVSNRGVIKF